MTRISKPEGVLLIVIVAALAVLLWNYLLRVVAMPDELRYIPPEASLFVVASSASTLWEATAPHVENSFRETKDNLTEQTKETPPREAAQGIVKFLKEKELSMNSYEDLEKYGIDPRRKIVFGILEWKDLIAVIPIKKLNDFQATLQKLTRSEAESAVDLKTGKGIYTLVKIGNLFLGKPEKNIALVATSISAVQRALADPEENLRYYRNSDALHRGFAGLIPSYPLQKGAWIMAHLRPPTQARYNLLGNVNMVLSIDGSRVRLGCRTRLEAGEAQVVRRLIEEDPSGEDSIMSIPDGINAALLLRDRYLPYFLSFLNRYGSNQVEEVLDPLSREILEEVAKFVSPTEVAILYLGLRGSIPELALAVRMNEEDARSLVFKLQGRTQISRDRRIIEQASTEYLDPTKRKTLSGSEDRHATPEGQQGDSAKPLPKADSGRTESESDSQRAAAARFADPQTLVSSGHLSAGPNTFWVRYHVGPKGLENPTFNRQDFSGISHRFVEGGQEFNYLLPVLTDEDFRYGLTEERRKQVDETALRQNLYRVCSTYIGGLLLIGTDADTVRALVKRHIGGAQYIRAQEVYRELGMAGAKIYLDANPRHLVDDGLLHPSSEVSNDIKDCLSDLGQYSSMFFIVETEERENDLLLNLVLKK